MNYRIFAPPFSATASLSLATALCLATALLSGWAGSAAAEDSAVAAASVVSANVTLTTDYRFRGISQGDRSPAIQGGFDLALKNGFYAGAWASNVTLSGGAIETDIYTGYRGNLNAAVSYDVGYLYYDYPENDANPDLNYEEFYGSVSYAYTHATATLGLNYSNDYFAQTDKFWYVYGEYQFSPLRNLTIGLHLALNQFDSDAAFASFIGPAAGKNPGDHYLDWRLSATTDYYGVEWGLSFIGTNLNQQECFAGTKLCDNTVVLALTKSL